MKKILTFTALSLSLFAGDIMSSKMISTEFALDIAKSALTECRSNGYQVSVVIVDRAGNVQVSLRDVYASRFTTEIATRKANTVILSGVDSGIFRKNREDIRQELNHIDGIIVMEGGLPIEAAGTLVGAIGVSGAPGGDKDAACARTALQSVSERLIFASE